MLVAGSDTCVYVVRGGRVFASTHACSGSKFHNTLNAMQIGRREGNGEVPDYWALHAYTGSIPRTEVISCG
jgi:hypothetical protein